MSMKSEEFILTAKDAVVKALEKEAIPLRSGELETVWYAHVLGNKKCLLFSPNPVYSGAYFEVTYNCPREEIYVDIYQKKKNVRFIRKEDGAFMPEFY